MLEAGEDAKPRERGPYTKRAAAQLAQPDAAALLATEALEIATRTALVSRIPLLLCLPLALQPLVLAERYPADDELHEPLHESAEDLHSSSVDGSLRKYPIAEDGGTRRL